jgi:type VI secretion system protein VasJ
VGREVVTFIGRFPAILQMTFANGTPFADEGTKTWVEEEQKKYGGGGGGSSAASAAVSAEDEEVQKRFEEARAMVKGGKVADGLSLALALANRAADARTRFRSHLAVSRMALEGGKPEVARSLLEGLTKLVDQHNLEAWEPALCATLYQYLLSCVKASNTKGNSQEQASKEAFLFDKLSRLDPAAALRLAGS